MSSEIQIPEEAVDRADIWGGQIPAEHLRRALEQAGPLIVAGYLERVLDDWFHNRIKGSLSEYLSGRASVLRGEGDQT